ncbi:ATP-dependent DNA ligase [Catellatospora sp. TT07R-123]|uniref:non-homologous end-joining DNA ligase n=1 Tax=Catellatospora sp. TT07R-123 TaxID=2733863 RepID=UPI001B23297B|nr:non-homologous end-joining DNA ligase [Catellatospora sp. TT07R-123]GHJ50482.1 ATP-dependent DNA ligase [Catellatospora sp. TT07R-123]
MRTEVDGRQLTLSNLEKPLYPDGTTKAEVIDYYLRIAPVLLPHLADRALTRIRFPDGADRPGFFEKNAPAKHPAWVPLSPDGLIICQEPATLVWLANLAALELHTHQWRVGAPGPDRVVFDLDPGAPAGLDECRAVALALRDRLAVDGRDAYPKTSGRKGMQVSAVFAGGFDEVMDYARAIAAEFAAAAKDMVTDQMAKEVRPGRVFIDWSQNHQAKTTVSVYSLRAGPVPTVSAPLTWDEVAAGDFTAEDFTPAEVLARTTRLGDLHQGLLPASGRRR